MEVMGFLLIILFTLLSLFITINYRDLSNKMYVRKRLKRIEVGKSIIIPTEYYLYADYLITKGKGWGFTSKVGDVNTEISRIK